MKVGTAGYREGGGWCREGRGGEERVVASAGVMGPQPWGGEERVCDKGDHAGGSVS